jgi:capsular exopolysaccharide synthesis family protein
MLDLDGDTGLTNILVGDLSLDTVLHPTDTQNLKVLTTGPRPPSPAPLLESEAMGRLIEELKARTDLVVFDSPPTLVAADAQILGNLVDGVVLVVDANHTRKHDVVRAVETLRLGRAPLLGLALNMLRRRGGGYGYYYYYYYSHYDRYYHEDEPSKDV